MSSSGVIHHRNRFKHACKCLYAIAKVCSNCGLFEHAERSGYVLRKSWLFVKVPEGERPGSPYQERKGWVEHCSQFEAPASFILWHQTKSQRLHQMKWEIPAGREQSLFIQFFVLCRLIIGWGMLSPIKCFKCCVWIHLLDCENIANWRCCDTALQTAVACFLFFRSRKLLPPSHEFSHKLWQQHAV